MNQISVSIDKIIIEYTKVSMDFWNGYFMKNKKAGKHYLWHDEE